MLVYFTTLAQWKTVVPVLPVLPVLQCKKLYGHKI